MTELDCYDVGCPCVRCVVPGCGGTLQRNAAGDFACDRCGADDSVVPMPVRPGVQAGGLVTENDLVEAWRDFKREVYKASRIAHWGIGALERVSKWWHELRTLGRRQTRRNTWLDE